MILNMAVCYLLFVPLKSFSQDSVDVRDVTKANFFNPGLSYEKRIGRSQTLYAQAFLSTSFYIGYSSTLGNTSGIDIYPALTLQYRYYYNGPRREAKGRRTAMNSMNYVGIVSEANYYKDNSYGLNRSRLSKIFGALWGFQRNYPKRFSIDFGFGFAYAFSKKTVMSLPGEYSDLSFGEFTNIGYISLGFWLNKN